MNRWRAVYGASILVVVPALLIAGGARPSAQQAEAALKPKSIIGLPECLHGANRRSSARVVLPSTLRFVPLDALMAALQREPALCLKAAALISEEINSSGQPP